MKIQKKYFYYTNHPLSRKISEYFIEGFDLEGKDIKELKNVNKSGFFYGILRNCYEGMIYLRSINEDYYYVDHGFIRKDLYNNSYYRICKNSRFLNFLIDDLPSDRYEKLSVSMNFEKNKGTKVIIFEPSPYVCMINGINQSQWVNDVVKKVKKYTDREILVTRKSDVKNIDVFKDMYVLIHYASMGAIEALIKNIPIITLGEFFLEKYYNNSIENIENLKYCENREKILYNLSYLQYNLEEIKSGIAKKTLRNMGIYND